MNRSNNNGTDARQQHEHLQLFIWRIPKKNHDAMVQNCKRASDMHGKYAQRLEFFQLDSTELSMNGLTNIANVVSSGQEEEVWLELNFHKNRKHMEKVAVKMRKAEGENEDQIGNEFMNLISPGSCMEGGFSRISI